MSDHADLVKRLVHLADYMQDKTGVTVTPPTSSWPGLIREAATEIVRMALRESHNQDLLKHAAHYVDPASSSDAAKLAAAIGKATP